jgi:hypothetical protein
MTGTGWREPSQAQPLFRHILGEAWDLLPFPIRDLHSPLSVSSYSGLCTVTQGRNPIAKIVTALVGFPKAGTDLPINVKISVVKSGERWMRTMADRSFSSTQSQATGRSQGLVRERFGPIAVDLALVVEASRLKYLITRWAFLGIPLPLCLGPKTAAVESMDAQGRFHFDVKLWHPLLGALVHYTGWLRADRQT